MEKNAKAVETAQVNNVEIDEFASFFSGILDSNSTNEWVEKLPLSLTRLKPGLKPVIFEGGEERTGNGYNISFNMGKNPKTGKNVTINCTFRTDFFKQNEEVIKALSVKYAKEDDTQVDTTFSKEIESYLLGEPIKIKVEDADGIEQDVEFRIKSPELVRVAKYDAADATTGKYPIREKDSKYHKNGEYIFENFSLGYFMAGECDPEQARPKDNINTADVDVTEE